MSTVIPDGDLDPVLQELDQLSLADLKVFVATARATVDQESKIKLRSLGSARKQFRQDANELNLLTAEPGALNAWLRAAWLQLGASDGGLTGEVRSRYFAPGRTPPIGALEIPEKIILRDDTVSFEWLTRAVDAGGGTAWLSVPPFVNGKKREPEVANGTGFLLDPKHLVTCLHVLEAREPGQAKPDALDLTLQVGATRVAFGFLAGEHPQLTLGVVGLVASNPALDYAVVELEAATTYQVPTLFMGELPAVDHERAFVVNILQHPRGGAKRLAMRNNAVARVDDERIAYWTDTDYGSSGAPVFNDEWRVIALHRAYEPRNGLQYLGRSVGGANVGSRITKVVQDLQANAPQLAAKLKLTTS